MKLSNRLTTMQESPIRKLVPLAEQAKKKGLEVIHLNIGQPDIKTPKQFKQAINDFDVDVIAYSFSQGDPSLIKAIIEYYKRYDMDFAEDEVLITNGGSEALIFAIYAVADAGDEILIPEPFYTNYNGFSRPANVNVVPITTKSEEAFCLPPMTEIEKLITDKTKAILFSNPGNPTGAVYNQEELKMLAEIAIKYDLFIIADEVYREFVYEGLDYVSMGNIEGIQDRVIIVDSISKRFSACGARIGSLASKNKGLMASMMKLCQARLCVPTLEQVGATELYRMGADYFETVKEEYDRRRMIVYEGINRIDGAMCKKPRGAFYVVVDLPIDDADKFARWMLTDFSYEGATLMVAPAGGFYATTGQGKNQVRLAYVLEESKLRKGITVLEKALEAYNS
ncbi:pyridoxal phosphate-dependent aminotransferase [Clostridia bacterium]|nr:pyridoxal phosphate-dependent aminotransferase [Clostridia bacterium]